MWLVLLDHSSSMGGGFSNKPTVGRLVRAVDAETRLEAAKAAFLEQLGRLPQEMPVALFAFTSVAKHVLTAPAGASERFRAALATLSPDNGTDIAKALNTAADHIESLPAPPALRRTLLVSDGESALEAAVAAAERCRDLGMTIDALLIDPGGDSERLASRVTGVTAGRWDPVVSADQLRAGAAEAAETARGEYALAKAMLEGLQAEETGMAERRQAAADRVMFSAGYPARIQAERRYELRVVMHGEGERDRVHGRLEALLRDAEVMPKVTDADTIHAIPLGTVLRVEPTAEGLLFEPAVAELQWLGMATDAVFGLRHARTAHTDQPLRGVVDVKLQSGLLVAQLDLRMTILKPASEPPASEALVAEARPLERVFASYAHADEPVVRACKEAYAGLGITLWMDFDDIPQSAVWRNVLEVAIGKADVFQLFWSTSAAVSSEVRKEVELGRLVGSSRKGPFVRGVYWEPHPPPFPEDLAHLQMKRLVLGHLDLGAAKLRDAAGSVVAEFDIAEQVTTFSLIPDADDQTVALVRASMGRITAFVEDVTGLRYVPAPTLLVDSLTVRSVRLVETIDRTDAGVAPCHGAAADWLLPLLRALLMAFHTGKLEGAVSWDKRPAFYGLHSDDVLSEFDHVRRESEYGFPEGIRLRLEGQDRISIGEHWVERQQGAASLPSSADFVSYVGAFLTLVAGYSVHARSIRGDVAVKGTFRAEDTLFEAARAELAPIRMLPTKVSHENAVSDPYVEFEIPIADYSRCLEALRERVAPLVAAAPRPGERLRRIMETAVPAYGIFAAAHSGAARHQLTGLADRLRLAHWTTLPDTNRVLLCATAIADLAAELFKAGQDNAPQRAADLLRLVLVHEHFHAALAAGLDDHGRSAAAARRPDRWMQGLALNESLAAWAELHFARDDAWLATQVRHYVEAGAYPEWPYRGAEQVEQAFQDGGLPVVRELVRAFRSDPALAQAIFDGQAVIQNSTSI